MSQCNNSSYDTPVRHDDLPLTRKSLRTRVLISANSTNESKNCDKTKENKRLNVSNVVFSSTRMCDTASFMWNKEESCNTEESNIWEESQLKTDITPKGEAISDVFMDSFSSDSCDHIEASMIRQQKHSTPQAPKFSIRAVSSTPNQEVSSISKFTRNVFTQTNYTLSISDQEDLSGNLKSYCIEIPGDGNQNKDIIKIPSNLNATTELTSPLSHMCSSKLSQCEDTPVKNKQLVRKLSLRSKTMICSALEKSKDVGLPKKILSRHKSMEEKRLFSNTFSLMPRHKTPPSDAGKVFRNPFEVDLPNRLSKTIFSPDVFDNVVSPSQDSEELRWTIEDISSINPVPLDEDFSIPSDEDDPEKENRIQQEIDRYFSETHVVLSPDDLPKTSSIIEAIKTDLQSGTAASTLRKVNVTKEHTNSCSQTSLSFPAILPEDLEESLNTYFKIFETDEMNQSQCNLRRKLFFHTEDEPPSPVRFEMGSSPITKDMWKAESSPLSLTCRERHFTPVGRQQELSSPEISPVVDQFLSSKIKNNSLLTCKKTLHNFFHGEEVNVGRKATVVNSSVITGSDVDSCSHPVSQDTGYQTEDSVGSHLHFSTPTRTAT